MKELPTALAALGVLVLGIGLLSRPIKRTIIPIPVLALGTGVLLGPAGLGWLDPHRWGKWETILEEAARVTLAIALMGVALRLPSGYVTRHWRSLIVLIGFIMPLMCLSTGLLTCWLLGFPFLAAVLLGAIVAPTDPIVATSIVTGELAEKHLPDRLRHLLSAESGINDGMAYLLVLLPILLLTQAMGEPLKHWFWHSVLWEVGGAVLFGILLGIIAGGLLRWAEEKKEIEHPSFLGYTIALSLLALGAAKLLGTDGILAVFVTGLAFDRMVGTKERAEEEKVQEAINYFFTLPVFVLLGLLLPWEQWRHLGWPEASLAIAVLLLRRLPALLIFKRGIPQLQSWPDAWFLGWFGPMGISAILYAMLALRRTGREDLWPVASLIICASLVAHGMSAAPLTRTYGRRQAVRG